MKIISFAWTSPALVAGEKTVTRREWQPNHASRFQPGDLVAAYDRQPRFGGKQIATIRIVSVTWERFQDMPDSDYAGEGFEYLAAHPELLPKSGPYSDAYMVSRSRFAEWQESPDGSWVIRFELVEVVNA